MQISLPTLTVSTTPTCKGACDGSINAALSGGTAPVQINLLDEDDRFYSNNGISTDDIVALGLVYQF